MDKEYQDFDMTGAKRGIPPQIAHLKAHQQTQEPTNPLAPDVWQLILKKADNATEIARVNQLIRQALA